MTTTELITGGNAGRFAIPSERDLQAVYGVASDALVEMKNRLIVPDTTTPDGYKLAVSSIRECRELRVSIEAKRKDMKADSLAYGRAVDKVAKYLTEEIEAIEEPIKAAKKIVDDRIENERLEAERKANEERLAAERAKREEEERKLAEERAKLEAERKAMEEAQRIERERLAAERAAIEAEQRRQREAAEAELAKQRAAIEEEQRKVREQQAAEAKRLADEREAVEAERRRQEEAERARLAEIERQRREAEEAERAKQEAAEREATRLAALPEADVLREWIDRMKTAIDEGPDIDAIVALQSSYATCCEDCRCGLSRLEDAIDDATGDSNGQAE